MGTFLLILICFLSTQGCKNKQPETEAPGKKEKISLQKPTPPVSSLKPLWAWRKKFNGYELNNLVMSWNGEKLLFLVRENKSSGLTANKGDAIIGLDENGHGIRDWRLDKKIRFLSLSGNGETLVVEPDDGHLLYYKNWMQTQEPRYLSFQVSAYALAPSGRQMALIDNKALRVWDVEGSITDIKSSTDIGNAFFPFIEKETHLILVTDKGEIIMREGENILWKNKRPSAFSLLATSTLLQGDMIAVVSEGEILFLGERGKVVGTASISFPVSSLNCSPVGDLCAVYGSSGSSQEVSLFISKGRELWRHTIKEAVSQPSKVVVSNKGHVVAGIMELGQWYLQVWDRNGDRLQNIPVEGGLKEFQVSWSGEKMAALTFDGRIIYFKL